MKRTPAENRNTPGAKKPKVARTGAHLFKETVLDRYRRRDFFSSYGGSERIWHDMYVVNFTGCI